MFANMRGRVVVNASLLFATRAKHIVYIILCRVCVLSLPALTKLSLVFTRLTLVVLDNLECLPSCIGL